MDTKLYFHFIKSINLKIVELHHYDHSQTVERASAKPCVTKVFPTFETNVYVYNAETQEGQDSPGLLALRLSRGRKNQI